MASLDMVGVVTLGVDPVPIVRLGESRVGDRCTWVGQMRSGHFWRQYETGEVSSGRIIRFAEVQDFFLNAVGGSFGPADAPFPFIEIGT